MMSPFKVNIEENDAYISDTCSNFKNGKITVVVNPGLVVRLRTQDITTCLNQKGLIVGTFLDEFQMNLANHWGRTSG